MADDGKWTREQIVRVTEQMVTAILIDVWRDGEMPIVTQNSIFAELNFDDLDIIEILSDADFYFDVLLDEDITTASTVGHLTALIEHALTSKESRSAHAQLGERA